MAALLCTYKIAHVYFRNMIFVPRLVHFSVASVCSPSVGLGLLGFLPLSKSTHYRLSGEYCTYWRSVWLIECVCALLCVGARPRVGLCPGIRCGKQFGKQTNGFWLKVTFCMYVMYFSSFCQTVVEALWCSRALGHWMCPRLTKKKRYRTEEGCSAVTIRCLYKPIVVVWRNKSLSLCH